MSQIGSTNQGESSLVGVFETPYFFAIFLTSPGAVGSSLKQTAVGRSSPDGDVEIGFVLRLHWRGNVVASECSSIRPHLPVLAIRAEVPGR